jgi:hypothetical protein
LFFLQYGDRVLRIDLYPDRVEIITKFANFLPRTTIYKRRRQTPVVLDNGKRTNPTRLQTHHQAIAARVLSGESNPFVFGANPPKGLRLLAD